MHRTTVSMTSTLPSSRTATFSIWICLSYLAMAFAQTISPSNDSSTFPPLGSPQLILKTSQTSMVTIVTIDPLTVGAGLQGTLPQLQVCRSYRNPGFCCNWLFSALLILALLEHQRYRYTCPHHSVKRNEPEEERHCLHQLRPFCLYQQQHGRG